MDAANVDLKAFTDDFYVKLCGGHLQPVLDTLAYSITRPTCWLEITTLLIPGKNDSTPSSRRCRRWVAKGTRARRAAALQRLPPDWKDARRSPPTPPATLTHARRIALDAGLHYVYTGNVHDTEGDTTFCPGCGEA
jgi:pyruvate formate lyase activating enzyme